MLKLGPPFKRLNGGRHERTGAVKLRGRHSTGLEFVQNYIAERKTIYIERAIFKGMLPRMNFRLC